MQTFEVQKVFFVGAGSLCEAIVKGILGAQLLSSEQITVSNRKHPTRLQTLFNRYGVRIAVDKQQELAEADVVILAAKPYDLPAAIREIAPFISAKQVFISVAAGVSTDAIEKGLAQEVAVIRAMPNTSSFVQESATALCGGRWAAPEHMDWAKRLFRAIGLVETVREEEMDAVTGLAGSGPAYFYYIAEALIRAGQESGLSEEVSRALLIQTMYGAAKMLRETDTDPAELRRQVTSPNGTTMAAITSLDETQTQEGFINAVKQATKRAGEMGLQANEAFSTLYK